MLSSGGQNSLVQAWVAPWGCQERKPTQGCPSALGTPQGTWAQGSPQRCISPFPPRAPESQGGCEGLEGAAGSPLLTSSGCWAGVSYNQKRSQHSTVITEYKKNPKPGTRLRARPSQPTQGVPRRILCTASPRRRQHKRRQTESPNAQASVGRRSQRSRGEEILEIPMGRRSWRSPQGGDPGDPHGEEIPIRRRSWRSP